MGIIRAGKEGQISRKDVFGTCKGSDIEICLIIIRD